MWPYQLYSAASRISIFLETSSFPTQRSQPFSELLGFSGICSAPSTPRVVSGASLTVQVDGSTGGVFRQLRDFDSLNSPRANTPSIFFKQNWKTNKLRCNLKSWILHHFVETKLPNVDSSHTFQRSHQLPINWTTELNQPAKNIKSNDRIQRMPCWGPMCSSPSHLLIAKHHPVILQCSYSIWWSHVIRQEFIG